MIERHTFKQLIETIVLVETGIEAFEAAINCHLDDNWMVNTPCKLITAIANGFFDSYTFDNERDYHSLLDSKIETIEELLYHFVYMEDCGNNSEHCRSKLVIVDEGEDTEEAISCTCVDELYDVICKYLDRTDLNFTFNYCHSYSQDDKELADES